MDYPLNSAEPLVMHIDMNSSFASVEQQANRLLRHQPVGVAANMSPGGCIISPSREMKALGIKTGYRVRDAQEACPDINIIPSDPDKYFEVHKQFSAIFCEYSPHVTPLSIDEAVIDFAGTPALRQKTMVELGHEIKERIKSEIGEWMTCNVGIGTNRFLAKHAASLHKPDGLDVLTAENLREVYSQGTLLDLCGINRRNKARLNLYHIFTPLEFLDAPMWKLWKQVFESVQGYRWYLRLRGWEVDDLSFPRRTYGQSYALHHFTSKTEELAPLMKKLCEKMGRRLRRSGNYAEGIHVICGYRHSPGWHQGRKFAAKLYATSDLYERAMQLLVDRPEGMKLTHLAVSCYSLHPVRNPQLTLFETDEQRRFRLADALDACNNEFGEYSVHAGNMMGLENEIIKRVPFHATSDTLAEIYSDEERSPA